MVSQPRLLMFVEGFLDKQRGDKGGRIPMGAVITLIPHNLNIDTSNFIPLAGNHLYDLKGLAEVAMINDAKGLEEEEEEERYEDYAPRHDVGGSGVRDEPMGEAAWEVPMPKHQGKPWRHETRFDESNMQYKQFLQFQQYQQHQQQTQEQFHLEQRQRQQYDFFEGTQNQGYAPQFLPDCTPNYDMPPRQERSPEYWSRYTTLEV